MSSVEHSLPAAASSIPSVIEASFLCAKRGGQWLDGNDLHAHLAGLLRLENVGLLLGSGASAGPLGGKTMKQLWNHFSKTYSSSLDWLESKGFVTKGSEPNVETLCDSLGIAALEWKRVENSELSALLSAKADLTRSIILASMLQKAWWEDAERVSLDVSELNNHRSVLQKLISARQPGQPAPWIFSTNYDLAVEWAAESINLKLINGFDGLHRRVFSPHNFDLGWRNVLARGEARFGTYHVYLAKIHGSLSWQSLEDGSVIELPTVARWPEFKKFLEGGEGAAKSAPEGLLVLPSATKYSQTVGFVLGELFRRLAEFLARPQTAIITSGYSFSDEHLNRVLLSALQNPTLQLVIYLPEAVRKGDQLDLENCSAWVRRVIALESPQVTIVGGGDRAYFSALAHDLPDPAVYDERAAQIRNLIKEMSRARPTDSEVAVSE